MRYNVYVQISTGIIKCNVDLNTEKRSRPITMTKFQDRMILTLLHKVMNKVDDGQYTIHVRQDPKNKYAAVFFVSFSGNATTTQKPLSDHERKVLFEIKNCCRLYI